MVRSYAYDPWGGLLDEQNRNDSIGNYASLTCPYTYAGYHYDPETGLYCMPARYYSPALRRFLQKDPHPGKRSNPLTLNPYRYCENNPVLKADPSGQISIIAYIRIKVATIRATIRTWSNRTRVRYCGSNGDDDGEGWFVRAARKVAAIIKSVIDLGSPIPGIGLSEAAANKYKTELDIMIKQRQDWLQQASFLENDRATRNNIIAEYKWISLCITNLQDMPLGVDYGQFEFTYLQGHFPPCWENNLDSIRGMQYINWPSF